MKLLRQGNELIQRHTSTSKQETGIREQIRLYITNIRKGDAALQCKFQ